MRSRMNWRDQQCVLWQPFSPFQMQVCKEKRAICRNLIHCQIGYLRSQRNCSEIHLFYLHGVMFKHKGNFTLLICQLKSLVWLFHVVFGGIIISSFSFCVIFMHVNIPFAQNNIHTVTFLKSLYFIFKLALNQFLYLYIFMYMYESSHIINFRVFHRQEPTS